MTISQRNKAKKYIFHVIHKVPAGDSPYVKAKQVQLVDNDPGRGISMFWAAINAGDRVESALKDMALVMKQLDQSDEAIEAIKSFRHLRPSESQESLDNILVELFKKIMVSPGTSRSDFAIKDSEDMVVAVQVLRELISTVACHTEEIAKR